MPSTHRQSIGDLPKLDLPPQPPLPPSKPTPPAVKPTPSLLVDKKISLRDWDVPPQEIFQSLGIEIKDGRLVQ